MGEKILIQEEFLKLAKDKFKEKVSINKLKLSDEVKEYYNFTDEAIKKYPQQVWLLEDKCPRCNVDLLGLLGSFEWGIVHGNGYCSDCKKVEFKRYHYIEEGKSPLQLFAVIGF